MKAFGILIVLGLTLSGCASIVRGTTEEVRIITDPSDARITTTTGHACVGTPCKVEVARDTSFLVTASKDGYKTATVDVKTETTGKGVAGVAGNLIFGGVVGAAVDGYNGAYLNHTPNPVVITLEPTEPQSEHSSSGNTQKRKDAEKSTPVPTS